MWRVTMWGLAAVLACGCTTTDPTTGEEELNKKSQGAAVGAIGGAAAGAAAKGNKGRNMAIGAAVGSLVGLSVGAYMDKQEEALRQELKGSEVSVERDGDRLILNMPGNVTFDTADADIRREFHDVLASVASVLKKFDETHIEITGYTDSRGSEAFNEGLSLERAQSVASYLAAQGIAEARLESQGKGEGNPIASNDTAEGRQQNRRVELELTKVAH